MVGKSTNRVGIVFGKTMCKVFTIILHESGLNWFHGDPVREPCYIKMG